jgi:hypothetical protein
MARNGKIARLPRELREELNRRLAENEPDDEEDSLARQGPVKAGQSGSK